MDKTCIYCYEHNLLFGYHTYLIHRYDSQKVDADIQIFSEICELFYMSRIFKVLQYYANYPF